MNEKDLAALFRRLGAAEPGHWAYSQIKEGIPQLARFLFLRQAWREIVTEGDSAWIDRSIERAEVRPTEPYAGVGLALKKLCARGATDQEITDVVQVDDEGNVIDSISGLHESVLETDPTGREMRPREQGPG